MIKSCFYKVVLLLCYAGVVYGEESLKVKPERNVFGINAYVVRQPDATLFPEFADTARINGEEQARKPRVVKDKEGRAHYLVRLRDTAMEVYEAAESVIDRKIGDDSLGAWNRPAIRLANQVFEQEFRYKATGLFSWVLNGFTAFLTPEQVSALRKNSRVDTIIEDRYLTLSGLWSDTVAAQTIPWGIKAVGGPKQSNGSAMVYVVDAGVGMHTDLANVIAREANGSVPGVSPIGCYTHATAIAGIVGATNNASGVVGVDADVSIKSVGTITGKSSFYNCASGAEDTSGSYGPTFATISQAFDKIRSISANRVSVVNLSMNAPELATPEFRAIVNQLIAATGGNKGIFFVQSAGNFAQDACGYAYIPSVGSALPADGIMVVSAVDQNGQPVVPLNGAMGFRSKLSPTNTSTVAWQNGSNYGQCVDTWAPGNNIYSTGGGSGLEPAPEIRTVG